MQLLNRTIIFGIFLLHTCLFGQSYKIKVNIQGYTNDTLLLGYHFGDKQYIRAVSYTHLTLPTSDLV